MTILAEGQLVDFVSQQTDEIILFTVGGADVLPITRAVLTKVTFFNTSSVTQTIILAIRPFSLESRTLRQFELLENESGEYLEPGETLLMDNGDQLVAQSTTEDVVDFVIVGTLV